MLWGMPHDFNVPVLIPLSLSSPCSMTGVQFSVEHGLGNAVIGHPHKVSGPTKLSMLDVMFDASLYAALKNFSVWYHVLPLDVSDAPPREALVSLPNDPLALPIRGEISSSINASCDIVLPKYVNLSVTFSGLLSMVMVGAV